MRNSLSTRAARACAAGALVLSLALTPAIAAAHGFGHFAPRGLRGFDRFGVNHFRSNRFGFHRFGRNGNALDFGLLGLDGWGYWDYPSSYPTAPAARIIIGAGGPPVAINVYAGGGADAGDPPAPGGGACPVLHQLHYDKDGHYVGERQIPGC
jgi:hypothetical protein